MKIIVQLFGAYRPFGEQVEIDLAQGAQVSDIREPFFAELQLIDKNFNNKALLDSSRFATKTEILSENAALKNGDIIAIIPPVAGG